MPYYVYRIQADRRLEYLSTCTLYQEAKALVRALRTEQGIEDPGSVRLVFANSTGEAERLLSLPRDDRVIGED